MDAVMPIFEEAKAEVNVMTWDNFNPLPTQYEELLKFVDRLPSFSVKQFVDAKDEIKARKKKVLEKYYNKKKEMMEIERERLEMERMEKEEEMRKQKEEQERLKRQQMEFLKMQEKRERKMEEFKRQQEEELKALKEVFWSDYDHADAVVFC